MRRDKRCREKREERRKDEKTKTFFTEKKAFTRVWMQGRVNEEAKQRRREEGKKTREPCERVA